MAKRKIDVCDNVKDLEHKKFRINEDDRNEVSVATCDADGNAILQEISNKLEPSCSKFDAGETLSAVKLVYMSDNNEVSLADNAIKLTADVVGITRHSANMGESIEVLLDGEIVDSSFNFNFGETIYLSNNGNLTNVAPTTGVLTVIGKSLGNNKILIRIEEPIIL